MAENKTKATDASVDDYIAAISDEERRQDCAVLIRLMGKITGKKAVMWGPTIVGFDSYHYRYESGREGDAAIAGFSSRKPDLSVYINVEDAEQQSLLKKLGKHKMGKVCLSIRRLSDVDMTVLEQLIINSVASVKRRYPANTNAKQK